MSENEVTGGDILNLWKTANMDLAAVEDTYIKMTQKLEDEVSIGDEKSFGRVFEIWDIFREITQYAMYKTAVTARCSRLAIDLAAYEFTFVDGDTSKDLTAAGAEFLEQRNDPDEIPPKYVIDPKGDPADPFDDK